MVLHLVFNFVRNYASNHCKRTDFNVMFIILFILNALLTKLIPAIPCWSLIFVYFCASCWRTRMLEAKGKAVLVTGCDSGFGFILAKDLKNMGCKVFASVINNKGESAKTLKANGITVFQCDVSKDADIQKLIEVIEKELAGKPLWGIVNNAGISAFGDVEWTSIDIYKKLMDVNVWGVARVSKALIPLMRREGGRIVVMASGLGRIMQPSRSPYAISKWAVEALGEALRLELDKYNIDVSILEPGNYLGGTQILNPERIKELTEKLWSGVDDRTRKYYPRDVFEKRVQELTAYRGDGNVDLTPVIEDYKDALFAKWPLTRYQPMERYWKLRSIVTTFLPSRFSDWFYVLRHN